MVQQRDPLDEALDQAYSGQAVVADPLDEALDEVYGDRRDLKFARPPKKKGALRQAAEDIGSGIKAAGGEVAKVGRQLAGGAMDIQGGTLKQIEAVKGKIKDAAPWTRYLDWPAEALGTLTGAQDGAVLGQAGEAIQEAAPPPEPGLVAKLARGAGGALGLIGGSALGGVGGVAGRGAGALIGIPATGRAIGTAMARYGGIGTVGVLATGYAEGEAARQRALESGASQEVADRAYWDAATRPMTIVSGASEMAPLGRIFWRTDKFTGGALKRALKNALVEGGEEFIQGGGAEFVSILNENLDADEKRTIREILTTEYMRLVRAGLMEAAAVLPLSILGSAVGWKPAQSADAGRTLGGRSADGPDAIGGAVDAESGRSADGPWTLAGRSTDAAAGTPTATAGVAPLGQEPPVGQDAAPLPSPEEGAVGPEPLAPRSGPRPLISELEERYADAETPALPEGSVEAESGEQAVARVGRELREAGRAFPREAPEKEGPKVTWEPREAPPSTAFPDYEPGGRVSRVQEVPIEQLEPTEKIDEQQVAEVMRAMKEDPGSIPPLVAIFDYGAEDVDLMSVSDGHHRLEAARRLGMTHVPVRSYISPGEKGSLVIRTGSRSQVRDALRERSGESRPTTARDYAEAARALEASQEKRPLTRGDRARRAPTTRSELMQSLEEAADAARERIKGRGLRMYAGVDPAELKDELIVATNYVAKGVVKFADFAKEMVREFGESIRPHLRKLFDSASANHAKMSEPPPPSARPSIDHTLLSPSGRVSKRARAAALKREHDRLFPPGFWDEPPKTQQQIAQDKVASLRRSAKNLRDLAERGMSTRKFTKEADKQEAEALAIEKAAAEIAETGEGGQIPKRKTDTPAFRKWFGESKVVDEEGFPRTVYHGSPDVRGLTQFQTLQERFLGESDPERGFWFTDDRRVAGTYADDRRAFDYQGAEPGVLSVYLSIKNPLVIDAGGKSWRGTRDAIARARAGGHDGVIVRNVVDDYQTTKQSKSTTTYAVLNPEQIKSTENRGTFDPEDPTLLHAGISTPEVGALLKRFTGMPTESDTGSLVPPEQTGAQRTRQEVQAAMEPFERAAASSGRPEFQTVAERATTYQDRAAYAWGKIREGQVEPLLETVKEVGEVKAEAYLYARHATDANKVTRERTEGAKTAGSGMTDEQAAGIIKAAESGPHAGRFKALGRRWDALMQQNLNMMVEYKLITPETAARLKEMYPHYVPLKTLMDEGERQAMGIGKGADIRGPEFKVRLGRNTVADAPLAHGLAALQRTLVRGEKRRMLQPLVDLLAEEGGEIPGFVKLRRSNLVEDLPRNVVGLGPDLRLEFEPEYQDFVDAIQNPTGRSIDQRTLLGAITKHVGKLVRTVGGLATRHNPVFPIINALFRDPATAFFISAEHGVAFGVRVVKDGPKAWLAMFDKGSWAAHAETYRSLGGQMATLGMDDVQGHMENIQKLLSEPGTFKRGARALVRGLQTYADAGENAMRLSAFVHAQQDLGMAPEQAVFYSKNLTTNFRRKGLAGNYINAWWLFANPGIQGTHRAGQVVGNKNVQKLVGSAVAMSAIMDLINRMASDEDDDGVRFYDAIPEYVKRHNMLFTFDGRRYFKIPLPPIFNWFHALGTNLSEEGWDHWMGEDLSGSFVGDMAVAAMDSFNPLGGSDNALSILSPTPTDPAVELAFNEDFAGRQIAKLPFPGQQSPPSEQYWPDVNPTVEAITTKLNEWTGGDKYEAGKVSINPEWVEHLGKFLGSGTGQFLGQLYDIPDKMVRGEPVTSADIPLVRRLVQDPSPYALGGRYRDARDEVKLATKRTEGEPGPPTDKDRPLWALKGALSSAEKQINAKEEKLEQAKTTKLKAKLEAEIREIQAKFTRRVHEAKKALEPASSKE